MTWKPTVSQLCTIATIARELHITAEDFIAWRQAMMAAASGEATRLRNPEPVPRREPQERQARMTAARLFEMPAPEQGQG